MNTWTKDLPNQLAYLTFSCCSFTYFDPWYFIFWGGGRLHSSRISGRALRKLYTFFPILMCLLSPRWNLPFILVILQWIVQITVCPLSPCSIPKEADLYRLYHPLVLATWGTSRISESWRREARASSTRTSVWQWLPSSTEGHSSCPSALNSSFHSHPLASSKSRGRNSFPLVLNFGQSPSHVDFLTTPHFSKSSLNFLQSLLWVLSSVSYQGPWNWHTTSLSHRSRSLRSRWTGRGGREDENPTLRLRLWSLLNPAWSETNPGMWILGCFLESRVKGEVPSVGPERPFCQCKCFFFSPLWKKKQ